jgi:hypothetical protein
MRLATLIDLAVQMHRDRDLDSERLRGRDAVLGAAIQAKRLSDTEAVTEWLLHRNQVKQDSKPSVGEQAVGMLQITQIGLGFSGLVLGGGALASALAFDTHTNIIPLWSILVGSQIILLGLWLLAVLPCRWILWLPGASAVQKGIRFFGRIPMQIFLQAARWFSPSMRTHLRSLRGEWQRFGAFYGDLTRWLGIQLTQVFALAFNLGMVLTFLALSYGNDPTFGWRSTMLSSTQMHQAMQTISWPWSSFWPGAVPSLEVVSYVKDSSIGNNQITLDPEQRIRDLRMWASLWPFLLASLCFYGVLPRILTLVMSLCQVHRHLRLGPNQHLAIRALLHRLRRPRIVSESDPPGHRAVTGGQTFLVPASDWQTTAPLPVFQWAGVPLGAAEVIDQLRNAFGVEVAFCERVGELDPREDEAALTRLKKQTPAERVVVLVEGWESPDADYLDFICRLRLCVAPETEISVMLYAPQELSQATDPAVEDIETATAEQIWRTFLTQCGDPHLSVSRLPCVELPRSDNE